MMICRIQLSLAMLVVLLGSTAAFGSDAPPRYKLAVGQELQYQSHSESTYQNGAFRDEGSWRLWVVGRNENGSMRVIARTGSKFTQVSQGRDVDADERVNLFSFDVFPDGRVVPGDPNDLLANPGAIFPKLPDDATQRSWNYTYRNGERTDYTALPDQSSEKDFVFSYEVHSMENEIYLMTNTGTNHFDPQRGLFTSQAAVMTQGYGFHSKGAASLALKSVETKDDAFVKQLASEFETFHKASADYDDLETQASKDAQKTDALMKQAADELRDARSKLKLKVFVEQIDKTLAKHDRVVSEIKDDARRIAQVINKPAADWTLRDWTTQQHSLKDYRGKVVVLDFWYRGCGWCMKAMPQVKQLAADFKNDPVVVLGMNTDRKDEDADFVIRTMGLNYNTLHAIGIPDKYGVEGFPTLILIDPQGIVRDVHVGYSPHLRADVAQQIRKYLPASAPQ